MKKNQKKALLALSICAGLGVSAFATMGLNTQVNAYAETVATQTAGALDFHSAKGASVRLADQMGIRFEAYLDQDTYTAVANKEATFGMIIVSKANYESVTDGKYHEGFEGKYYKDFTYTAEQIIANNGKTETNVTDFPYMARAAIVNMLFDSVDQELVGISYVKVGETYTYSASEARTIAQVAKAELANYEGETEDSSEELAFLKEIGRKSYALEQGMTVDGENYLYGGETYTAETWKTPFENILTVAEKEVTLQKKYINGSDKTEVALTASLKSFGEEVDGAQIEWKSSDDTVATVANGVVKATGDKIGSVTITASYAGKSVETAVTVEKSVVESDYDLGDIDLSTGAYSFALSAIEAEDYTGSVALSDENGVYEVSVADGKVAFADLSALTWGEKAFTIELDDYILENVSAVAVTKILKTADDLAKIQEYAGGRDATTDAYEGYFILGNTIDLGSTVVNAKVDGNSYKREATRGFQGVFDGRGYVIANGLYQGGGLFGTVGQNGIVKNVAFYNATVKPLDSAGMGILGVKYFGTLENSSIDCTMTGTVDNFAPISYSALGATFKNLVLTVDYAATLKKYANNCGVLVAFNAAKGHDASASLTTPNVYENVYVISNRTADGKVTLFDEINAQNYTDNGIKAYVDTATNMTFGGLDSEYWITTGIPHFKAEDTDLTATYTVKHVMKNVGSTANVVGKTEVKKAIAGSTVTEYGYGYRDRIFTTEVSGTVLEDNSLVLECTYTNEYKFKIENDQKALYYFEMNGSASSGEQILDFVGDFEGQTDVWRMTSTNVGYNSRLKVVSIDAASWATYNYLEFKLYASNMASIDVIPTPATGGAYNVGNLANDTKGCIKIFDLDGTQLTTTPASGWIIIRVYREAMASALAGNFKVGIKSGVTAIPYYITDAKFVK